MGVNAYAYMPAYIQHLREVIEWQEQEIERLERQRDALLIDAFERSFQS